MLCAESIRCRFYRNACDARRRRRRLHHAQKKGFERNIANHIETVETVRSVCVVCVEHSENDEIKLPENSHREQQRVGAAAPSVSSALFKCARQQRRVHRRHILTHIIYRDKKKKKQYDDDVTMCVYVKKNNAMHIAKQKC